MLWIEKNDHKVRYCPTISSRGREVKQDPCDGTSVGEQNKNFFYVLQANKEVNPDEGAGKLYFHTLVIRVYCVVHDRVERFFPSGRVW